LAGGRDTIGELRAGKFKTRKFETDKLASTISPDEFGRKTVGSLAAVAQLVERVLGKDEVTGPSPVSSSDQNRVIIALRMIVDTEVMVET
jgi:hypothetical protein